MMVLGNRIPSGNPSVGTNQFSFNGGGFILRCTHSDFLPSPGVEKNIAALLTLGVWSRRLWLVGIFGEPHSDTLVEAPVAVVPRSTWILECWYKWQLQTIRLTILRQRALA